MATQTVVTRETLEAQLAEAWQARRRLALAGPSDPRNVPPQGWREVGLTVGVRARNFPREGLG